MLVGGCIPPAPLCIRPCVSVTVFLCLCHSAFTGYHSPTMYSIFLPLPHLSLYMSEPHLLYCELLLHTLCYICSFCIARCRKWVINCRRQDLDKKKPDELHRNYFLCSEHFEVSQSEQELSYRQQMARQLRTQYAAGIYRHKYYTVTLKSRLRITQGHWKRNHWTDHTRLSSSRVI